MPPSTFKTEKRQEEKTNFNQEWQHSTLEALRKSGQADSGIISGADQPFPSMPTAQWGLLEGLHLLAHRAPRISL